MLEKLEKLPALAAPENAIVVKAAAAAARYFTDRTRMTTPEDLSRSNPSELVFHDPFITPSSDGPHFAAMVNALLARMEFCALLALLAAGRHQRCVYVVHESFRCFNG
jgi:hypothetical protein